MHGWCSTVCWMPRGVNKATASSQWLKRQPTGKCGVRTTTLRPSMQAAIAVCPVKCSIGSKARPVNHSSFMAQLLIFVSLRDCLFRQVPGGFLAQRYGGHIMLMISFALWSVASLLTPKTALNSGAITAARVLVGVAQGFIIPSIHTVLSQARPCPIFQAWLI